MDAIMAARAEMKELAAREGVPKFTLMPLLMKARPVLICRLAPDPKRSTRVQATSLALSEFPILNSSISEDGTQIIIKVGALQPTSHPAFSR